jgi:alpha-ketoglutarate-dependent 2,4-dichlorophenoxyacetate dioxygenase
MLTTTPLSPQFGVEIIDCDLRNVTDAYLYPEIREAFETHSALLFRNQSLTDDDHLRFGRLFGPIEDREADNRAASEQVKVSPVSNVQKDGSVTDAEAFHTLNLRANMLWHVDSTFLTVPALANILIARVAPSSGGGTLLASTRAAWVDIPDGLKDQIRDRAVSHHVSRSRARLSKEFARDPLFHKWPAQTWGAVWVNPSNGFEALYLASHAYAVEGYDHLESEALVDKLIAFATQPKYVYAHKWRVGDVLIWDQRAVLHRGSPWPYNEPRILSSICVSARSVDGLASIETDVSPVLLPTS